MRNVLLGNNEIVNEPDSIAWIALAFASSSAVTHCCRSTSVAALMWKVWVPPLLTTKVHASTVCIKAPCKEIVPRQVWDISAGFLRTQETEARQSRERVPRNEKTPGKWNAEWHRKRQTWVCNWERRTRSLIIIHFIFFFFIRPRPSGLLKQHFPQTGPSTDGYDKKKEKKKKTKTIVCVNLWHRVVLVSSKGKHGNRDRAQRREKEEKRSG